MPKINSPRRKMPGQGRGDATRAKQEVLVGRELSTAIVLFHEAVAVRLGMTAAEWKCFGLLDLYGACTAGRLAELSGLTTGAITGVVDRLERAGHVRRVKHPKDRRSVIIQPVAFREVRARVAPVFESLGAAMHKVSSHFTGEQMVAVGEYLRRTTEALRGETAKLTGKRK